jgi:hypothetical protein
LWLRFLSSEGKLSTDRSFLADNTLHNSAAGVGLSYRPKLLICSALQKKGESEIHRGKSVHTNLVVAALELSAHPNIHWA